jgi:hypothetical protein
MRSLHPVCTSSSLTLVLTGPTDYRLGMCRSIKTLRAPYVEDLTPADIEAAALQYVRKVAGMRAPSTVNQPAFDRAVAQIADATAELLDGITVRVARAG